jgi:hypothetical protein
LSPSVLWPPNHELTSIHAQVVAKDDVDASPKVVLISITSDEPDQGDIQGAAIGTADYDFQVRAERAEQGDGRTYTVCYEARDASGNQTRRCEVVTVPHDRHGVDRLATIASDTLSAIPTRLALAVPPTHGELILLLDLPRTEPASVDVFDVAGRRVLSRDVTSLGP